MSSSAYTMNGWISDVAAPRDATSAVSPHGRVRVWLNPTVVASMQAGNGVMVTSPPHTANSMVVKELYDDAGTLVGHAASLKVDAGGGGMAWQYYCKAPAGRCYSSSPDLSATPMFAKGDANCGGCHGGLVFTMLPP